MSVMLWEPRVGGLEEEMEDVPLRAAISQAELHAEASFPLLPLPVKLMSEL